MATANKSPSPSAHIPTPERDHAADGDDSLARKRQRFSEEAELIIEAAEPEDIGASLNTAIMIDEDGFDDSSTMPYSDEFNISSGDLTPEAQLMEVYRWLDDKYYTDPGSFNKFAAWLPAHISDSDGHQDRWHELYAYDEQFFSHVAVLVLKLFEAEDLFDPKLFTDSVQKPQYCTMFRRFFDALASLSIRMVSFLPTTLDGMLARRDSVQPTAASQLGVSLTSYTIILANLLRPSSNKLSNYLHRRLGVNMVTTSQNTTRKLAQVAGLVLPSLNVALSTLSARPRDFNDAWPIIVSTVTIASWAMQNADETFHTGTGGKQVEDLVNTVNQNIVPAICQKHPRALPPDFHEMLIAQIAELLAATVQIRTLSSSLDLYTVCCGPSSGLKSTMTEYAVSASRLEDTCLGDKAVLGELIKDSWLLPVLKDYMSTDILDIRSKGIVSLRERLTQTFNKCNGQLDSGHPVLQHLAYLLRIGDFTEYIFSADSHANLVKECSDVVGFLAATKMYTKHETDVIWKACTTSVEAEFVKTSFDVLRSMLKIVDTDQVHYIARRYASTPTSQLNSYAVAFLSDVLPELRLKATFHSNDDMLLEPVQICYEIMKDLDQGPLSPSMSKLRLTAMAEIMSLLNRDHSIRDRLRFYETWVTEIKGRTIYATTSLDLLARFLVLRTSEETKCLLDMFSVHSAVDALVDFIHDARTNEHCGHFSIRQAVGIRLGVALSLVGLSDSEGDSELERRLWTYTIGDRAISNQAREDALDQFVSMTPQKNHSAHGSGLFERCIDQFLPAMSAEYATPRLVTFLHQKVRELEVNTPRDKLESVIDTSTWQQLVRIATTSVGTAASAAALSAINEVLFTKRTLQTPSTETAGFMALQATFARRLIESLVSPQQEADDVKPELAIERSIDILEAMHNNSKAMLPRRIDASSRIVLDQDKSNHVTFTVHIHGPQSHPKTRIIEASRDSTAGELNVGLQNVTGVAGHDLVSTGSMTSLDKVCSESLLSLGISDSSTVSIRPRYTFDCDFDKVFAATNLVEQEILNNFDRLEALLGGPDAVARKMLGFLSKVPPPALKRRQISSPTLSAAEIFPRDGEWLTQYSVHALITHLQDCNKIGVADQAFILRGARLLSDLLLEKDRFLPGHLLFKVLPGLIAFLQGMNRDPVVKRESWISADCAVERPQDTPPPPYLEDPGQLAICLFGILEGYLKSAQPVSQPNGPIQMSPSVFVVKLAYSALLQLARTENVWSIIQSTQRFVDVHAAMLLHDDGAISLEISGLMRDFCKERPDEAPSSYLHALLQVLPWVLTLKVSTQGYFNVLREALHLDRETTSSEEKVRSIVADLTKCVWRYQHIETADLAIMDGTLCNLLGMLSSAIDVLKSFKVPLRLGSISRDFYRFLLFPESIEPESEPTVIKSSMLQSTTNLTLRPTTAGHVSASNTDESDAWGTADLVEARIRALPLFHSASRAACFDVVRKTAETTDDYAWLMARVTKTVQVGTRDNGYFPQGQWLRNPTACAGLTNLGMTCYMNSLLQQLYSNIHFRHFICKVSIVGNANDGLLLHLKHLFARLQNLDDNSINTQPLAKYLGVSTDVQDDVHGFYTELLSKLEQEMPDASTKKQLNQLFSGTLVTQIQGSCGHVSSRSEAFSDLSLTVQNKSTLADSFSEFVQGEPMQGANKYKCLSCDAENGGKLVDAMKRTCLKEAPDHLTICLKRFTYDMLGQESKINDFFEFPEEIDLSLYEHSHLQQPSTPRELDIFKLVGVIVHSGVLSFGHYWSYVRLRGLSNTQSSKWVRLEDTTARDAAGFEEVRDECFGGRNTSHNGYVLFYQRQSSFETACDVVESLNCHDMMKGLIPPRVRIPDDVFQDVHLENQKRHRTSQLFEESFHNLIFSVCKEVNAVSASLGESVEESSCSSTEIDTKDSQVASLPADDLDSELVDLTYSYLVHVLLVEKEPRKLQQITTSFRTALWHQFLARLHVDDYFFHQLMNHSNSDMRTCVRGFFTTCLRSAKQAGSDEYLDDVALLVSIHARMLPSLDPHHSKWLDYFYISFEIALLGEEETHIIMNAGYCQYILEILSFAHPNGARRSHVPLHDHWRKYKVNLGPLYEFMACIVAQPGVLTDYDEFLRGGRFEEAGGLVAPIELQGRPILPWLLTAIAQPDEYASNWESFRAGNLVKKMCTSPDPRFKQLIVESAYGCFRVDKVLGPQVFHMTANLLSTLGDDAQEARRILQALLSEFNGFQYPPRKDMLNLLSVAQSMVPLAVTDMTHLWASNWLEPRYKVSKKTETVLKLILFDPVVLSVSLQDDTTAGTALDIMRANQVRDLVARCGEKLQLVSGGNEDRTRWSAMINAMQEAHSYLSRLVRGCRTVQENMERAVEANEDMEGIVTLAPDMLIEYDECRGVLREAQALLADMREWDAGGLEEDDDELLEESTDDFVTEDEELQ